MLRSLHVEHYVLIDSLEIRFPEGFIVLTGQTGAGKSILLGALSLLMGAKADAAMISDGAATASLVVFSIAVGLIGFFLGRYNIKLPLFWASSMASIPYFCAGHIAFRYTKILTPHSLDRWNIPFALLGFGVVIALAWNSPPESVSYVSNRYWIPVWIVYPCGLLGTLALFRI